MATLSKILVFVLALLFPVTYGRKVIQILRKLTRNIDHADNNLANGFLGFLVFAVFLFLIAS